MRYTKIFEVLNKDYDHEIPDIPRSKEFSKEFKRIVSNKVKKLGWKVVNHHAMHCECSGFITDGNDNYIYYNSGDYRFQPCGKPWYNDILIRRTKDENDYRGGCNHFTTLDDFEEDVKRLMQVKENFLFF